MAGPADLFLLSGIKSIGMATILGVRKKKLVACGVSSMGRGFGLREGSGAQLQLAKPPPFSHNPTGNTALCCLASEFFPHRTDHRPPQLVIY